MYSVVRCHTLFHYHYNVLLIIYQLKNAIVPNNTQTHDVFYCIMYALYMYTCSCIFMKMEIYLPTRRLFACVITSSIVLLSPLTIKADPGLTMEHTWKSRDHRNTSWYLHSPNTRIVLPQSVPIPLLSPLLFDDPNQENLCLVCIAWIVFIFVHAILVHLGTGIITEIVGDIYMYTV